MSPYASTDYLQGLVTELRKLPAETGWVEFKENNSSPEEIGEYLSALSNAAVLNGKANAYLVWGIRDQTHEVTGTTFKPSQSKKGNEDLENWLLRLLSPRLHFRWYEFEYQDQPVVLLEIPRASGKPTQFSGVELIRVGSYRKKLKEYPELERELWRIFDTTPFEDLFAVEQITGTEVLRLLDVQSFLDSLGLSFPSDSSRMLDRLEEERLVVHLDSGHWSIRNLGGLLFAKKLSDFARLGRKALRVVVYRGRNRFQTEREELFEAGYAKALEPALDFIAAVLPRNEEIQKSLRREVTIYPELAIRELVANALIHQDFQITGAGPIVEIFEDRMEITNPGEPLVDTQRFLDSPPRSRNESLASFMRRIGKCEERGSGIDKVVIQTELFQLPAPAFEVPTGSTRAVLFAHKRFSEMDRKERIRACYLHAGLKWLERGELTNTSLRDRFGIEERNKSIASRIIADTVKAGLIKPSDEKQGKKYAKYLPFWA